MQGKEGVKNWGAILRSVWPKYKDGEEVVK